MHSLEFRPSRLAEIARKNRQEIVPTDRILPPGKPANVVLESRLVGADIVPGGSFDPERAAPERSKRRIRWRSPADTCWLLLP